MTKPDDVELRQVNLQEQELELKRAQLAVDFAKFGFKGTLSGGFGGMVMIIALAILDAYSSDFTFGAWGVVGTSLLLVVAVIGFGAFSLWQPVKILARFANLSLNINSDEKVKGEGQRK